MFNLQPPRYATRHSMSSLGSEDQLEPAKDHEEENPDEEDPDEEGQDIYDEDSDVQPIRRSQRTSLRQAEAAQEAAAELEALHAEQGTGARTRSGRVNMGMLYY